MISSSLAKLILSVWILALVPETNADKNVFHNAAKTKDFFLVSHNQGVTFNYVEIVVEKDMSPVLTSWGDFIVDQAAVAKAAGRKTGYINVFLHGEKWMIDNMRVNSKVHGHMPKRLRERLNEMDQEKGSAVIPPEEPPPASVPAIVSSFFDLGKNDRSRSVVATVIFTKKPLEDTKIIRKKVKQLQTTSFAMVGKTELDFGGANESGDKPFTAEAIGTPTTAKQTTSGRGPNNYWYEQTPAFNFNVDAATNQCVPMAYANMLRYLDAESDLRVFHPHAPGVGLEGQGKHTLVGTLDVLMDRHVESWNEGSGVGKKKAMKGVMKYMYLTNQQDDVKIRHHGGDLIYGYSNMISYRVTAYPRFNKVCDEVKQGHGVTMRVGKYNAKGERTGGHALRIVACGAINGVQKIRAIDDIDQGNTDQRRSLSSLDSGLREREFVISHMDNDGYLNVGNDLRELEFVAVVEVDPSSGGGGP